MPGVSFASWVIARVGVLVVGAGLAAILVASIQGMALVPGGSIVDGYDVGLLPWTEVGAWLVPLGGVIAAVAGLASIWLGRAGRLARVATIPAILVVLFWFLLVGIGTAPRNGVDGTLTSSSVATFVYSSPANTGAFLLIPAAFVVLIAAVARRRAV